MQPPDEEDPPDSGPPEQVSSCAQVLLSAREIAPTGRSPAVVWSLQPTDVTPASSTIVVSITVLLRLRRSVFMARPF
jgi:hypothetical protein